MPTPFWEKNCPIITSNRFLENITDSKLYLLNNGHITRVPDNPNHRATAIDLSLISPTLAPFCSWSPWSDTLNSDHLPIIISLDKSHSNSKEKTDNKIPKFKYKFANWDKFSFNLSYININDNVINVNSVDDLYSIFRNHLINSAKDAIPQINLKPTHIRQGNVWWNEECEKARSEKWIAFKKYLKEPSHTNLINSKKAKNHSNRVNKEAKRKYWANFCTESLTTETNMQKIWEKVKTMKNGLQQPKFPINIDNNQLPSQADKAEAFADHFAINSTLLGLSNSDRDYRLQVENTPLKSNNTHPTPENLHINKEITRIELLEQVNLLNNKTTSVGIDGISNIMLKQLPSNMLDFLLKIFNKCWAESELPSVWKQAIIVPIHKLGKPPEDINSYRPIALTSHVGKLMEKIILNRLNHFNHSNNIIPNNQAGFRKGRCTTEHLVKLTTQIKQQFARRKNVIATFFDVSKAFDQVWHHRLIEKLLNINLGQRMTGFIQNFLKDRSIMVRISNIYSQTRNLYMGLPQGSVLSPTLFNIFMANLPTVFAQESEVAQFADDICLWQKVSLKKIKQKNPLLNTLAKKINKNWTKFKHIYLITA